MEKFNTQTPIKSLENKENLNHTEVVIGNKTYNLETKKTTFLYPENIQKETGIIGYERQSLDYKNLQELIKDTFKGNNNLEIKNGVIFDKEFVKKHKDNIPDPKENIESFSDVKDLLKFTVEKHNMYGHLIFDAIGKKLCESFTNNEFPNQTFNHVMGGYEEAGESHKKQFISDRIFLQKVLTPEWMGKMLDQEKEKGVNFTKRNEFEFFSTETGQKIKELLIPFKDKVVSLDTGQLSECFTGSDYWKNRAEFAERFGLKSSQFPDIKAEEIQDFLETFQEFIKKNNITLVNNDGVSVQDFAFWRGTESMIFENPAFGFSSSDGLFKEYLLKSNVLMSNKLEGNNYTSNNDYMLEHSSSTAEYRKTRAKEQENPDVHPSIKIFINNPDVPELRWGFCKYAVIPTEKGLNFIKMIHKSEQESPKENRGIENKENLQGISKIHFLVHPGYLSDERTRVTENDETVKYHALFEKYISEAKNLKNNELMIALTHTSKNEYQQDLENNLFYLKKLRELKDILGKRLIVLGSDFDFFSGEEVMQTVKDISKQRGYIFDENVLSDAYGETLGACVDGVAQNLNTTGNFLNKTKIRSELTDAHNVDKLQLDELKKQIQKEYNRLDF